MERLRVNRCWWLGAVGAGAAPGILVKWRDERPAFFAAVAGPSATRRETRPTLDPARFVGKARLAHQVARDIPDTLDQLYGYSACDKTIGHRSLLSCYTDGHAAT